MIRSSACRLQSTSASVDRVFSEKLGSSILERCTRCRDADIFIFQEIKNTKREKERKRKNMCRVRESRTKSDKMCSPRRNVRDELAKSKESSSLILPVVSRLGCRSTTHRITPNRSHRRSRTTIARETNSPPKL